MSDTDGLKAERDRIEGELRGLEGEREALEKQRAGIKRRTEAAAGDGETLAKLTIETEQMTEAKRKNDWQIAQATKRFEAIEETIEMQIQSDMT